jgi:CubicO group peptidase (beta-lactamase class C family)
MNMTSRDMAKIGYLYLNNGLWNGTQIFLSEWASRSSSEYINLGTYDPSLSHAGYGYQMWNIPSMGVYYAIGMYGQSIYMFPAYDLIVVFTATMYDSVDPKDIILTEYIIPSILDDSTQSDAVLQVFYFSFLLTMTIPLLIIIPYSILKELRLR